MALADNKRAKFDYEMVDEVEAGVEMTGFEVKAVKDGKVDITGSHAIIRGGEAYIVGMKVQSYQPGNEPENFDTDRTRKLLLHREEIVKLAVKANERGLTIVPMRVYNKAGKVKVLLGLAKSKKKFDKREKIKKKDVQEDIERNLKNKIRG